MSCFLLLAGTSLIGFVSATRLLGCSWWTAFRGHSRIPLWWMVSGGLTRFIARCWSPPLYNAALCISHQFRAEIRVQGLSSQLCLWGDLRQRCLILILSQYKIRRSVILLKALIFGCSCSQLSSIMKGDQCFLRAMVQPLNSGSPG